MSRPEVTLENYEELYSYYGQHEPSELALKGLHLATRAIYMPETHYAAGAEATITSLLENDHRLIMTCNHINMLDQLPVAAMMREEEAFRPVVGHTSILAKQPYFRNPLARRLMDTMGAIPVFRAQDTEGSSNKDRLAAANAMIGAAVERIEAGGHLFLFPEGTRNRDDRTKLGKIQSGVGRIATRSAEVASVAIVPMAIWYGNGSRHSLQPTIFVNKPITKPFETPNKLTHRLAGVMAASLREARELSHAP